jgi:FMN reductase
VTGLGGLQKHPSSSNRRAGLFYAILSFSVCEKQRLKEGSRVKILGIGGSLSQKSRSLTCLKLAMQGVASAGAEVEVIDLRTLEFPIYRPDYKPEDYKESGLILEFLHKVNQADGLILACPSYHGTMSGAFKNTVDYFEHLPRSPKPYLQDKIVGLISVGSGMLAAPNTLTAMYHFCRAMRATVSPSSFPVANARKIFDKETQLPDERTIAQLKELGEEVVNLTTRFNSQSPKEV